MRRSILIFPAFAAALILLSAAAPLRADSLDYTYTSGGNVFTFQLPASSPITPDAVTAFNFTINNVMFSENGGAPILGNVDFFDATSGGFDLYTDGFNFFALTGGPILYSGSLSSPTLLTGTFSLTDFAFSDDGVPGSLTVTRVTGVSEPSSLLLLGIGAIALFGAAVVKRSLA